MSEVEVRKAKREDCKFIREFIQELADFEAIPNGPKIDHNVLEKDGFDSEPPLFNCHVATIDEKIIGYTIFYNTYSTWEGKSLYMEDLYVTSKYRNQGVGSKLLNSVVRVASSTNCCRLDFAVLKDNPATEFYTKKGAVDISSKENWHVYRLRKETLNNFN